MNTTNYVYILDSGPHLFIGVTGDLEQRVARPRRKLVWFEQHDDLLAAIDRERQLKRWNRAWKAKLVSNENPEWRDLYQDLTEAARRVRQGERCVLAGSLALGRTPRD